MTRSQIARLRAAAAAVATSIVFVISIAASVSAPRAETGAASVWFGTSNVATATGELQLQRLAQRLAQMPEGAPATLVARVSAEGHWSFINASGEAFTAANTTEIKRAFEILLPNAGPLPPTLILTGDSIFASAALLAQLPKVAVLKLGWADDTFPLVTAGNGTTVHYLAELGPNLLLELTTAAAFTEATLQLQRPMLRRHFRLLSLEPGGPHMLAAQPGRDRSSGRAPVDAIDPEFLSSALGSLRGQTAALVGRFEGDALIVKPPDAPQRALSWAALTAAAIAADVDLLVLKSPSPQQPGGRNWLWQNVEIKGLEYALGHATLADFLAGLGSPSSRLVLTVSQASADRTILQLSPVTGLPAPTFTPSAIGNVVSNAVSGMLGNIVHEGAVANFRSAARQAELERRLLPFLSSSLQWLIIGFFIAGCAGAPVSWRWWQRLWPAEQSSDYAQAQGLWAARAVRVLIFVLVFLPLVAPASAPAMLARAWSRGKPAAPLRKARVT